jgi:tRNA(adenine34) deaminase
MSQISDTATAERLVRLAMELASKAIDRGDPPFGAVLADSTGRVLAKASNKQVTRNDPTAHAEITLIRVAARTLERSNLDGLHVVTNAEPCSMCLSALVKSRVAAITYGAPHEPQIDPPLPAEEIVRRSRHHVELSGGVLASACAAQIEAARRVNPAVD